MDNNGSANRRRQTVVLLVMYPGGGIGHVGPMTHLAGVFLDHGYDVTMVLVEPPTNNSTESGAGLIDHVAAANPRITFHVLPPLPPPDLSSAANAARHPYVVMLEFMRGYNAALEGFLRSITPRGRLHSLVIDMFCTQTIDVARRLRVPVYAFFPSPAGFLAVLTQLPALLAGRGTAGLGELGDAPLDFLGVPPLPASHLVKELLGNPEEELCRTLASVWKRNTDDTQGVLVNTFSALEARALQAFADPLCVPGQALPPVYAIGPLVANAKPAKAADTDRHQCLAWLDAQPERSVVFLCWGSQGSLSEEQMREIAAGLEGSGQRFLWVVRALSRSGGRDDGLMRYLERRPEPDLAALLPEGFVERTEGRGLVLTSWAPQVDVLGHPAVGAFVTHCGWNSALEAVAAGVPLLCWPLAAEQKLNKVLLVADDGMGVGVELEGYNEGFITAQEIEAKVRLVLGESEEGRKLRTRAAQLKKDAEAALQDGGSSRTAFLRFLSDVENLTLS